MKRHRIGPAGGGGMRKLVCALGVIACGLPAGGDEPAVSAARPALPPDLVVVAGAEYADLEGLASGGREAQERQRSFSDETGLPLEAKTAKTGIALRLVPPGKFLMGSPESEDGRLGDEGPQREVTISSGLYVGKYEVTQGQWQAVMGDNPSRFKAAGTDAPVEQVSWDDCREFLKKLCDREGVPRGTYRLLTEAEWEYACRAGTQTALYTGPLTIRGACNGPELDGIGWYGGNSGVSYEGAWDSSEWPEKQYEHSRAGTHPVGRKKANGWGLHDMIGNVGEWCSDWYGEYPSSVQRDPAGPSSGSLRVGRGGCWFNYAGLCRSADRDGLGPGIRFDDLGFRLARQLPPSGGR